MIKSLVKSLLRSSVSRRMLWGLMVFGALLLFGWAAFPFKAFAVTVTFTASSTWTAPAGVTSVQAEAWGGGGGGGGQGTRTSDGGGGGGGGAYSRVNSTTTVPGTNYTVSVGAQGTGGNDACGTAGKDSWFSNSTAILAKGGQPGCVSTGVPPAGGLGGATSTSVGNVKFAGGQGEIGRDSSTGRGGYGGSSAGTAADGWSGPQAWSTLTYPTASTPAGGGRGGDGGAAAANGSAPASENGGGGGGSGDSAGVTAYIGGAGAVGKIILTYSSSTITATSTQTASMNIPSASQYVGGAFVILPDVSSTITSITITENGTVNASTGLDNILLRYDLDTTAPYDCSDQSYANTDTQYGSTDTDGFSSANGTSTFTGAVLASSTQAMCVYVELDVVTGASGNLEIRIATSSNIITGGFITGTFPLDIPGTTSLNIAAPTISCSTNILSTSFGALTASSITTSTSNASTTMSCSGTANGCTLYVSDAGSGANPGLWNSTSSALIESPNLAYSATATLVAGTEGYGIRATTTAAGGGGALGVLARYNPAGVTEVVGGLTTSTQVLASSTTAITTAREIVVTHKAAASSITPGGTYDDTITYSCLSN